MLKEGLASTVYALTWLWSDLLHAMDLDEDDYTVLIFSSRNYV